MPRTSFVDRFSTINQLTEIDVWEEHFFVDILELHFAFVSLRDGQEEPLLGQ